AQRLETMEEAEVDDAFAFRDTANPTWIHVSGLHDPAVVEALGAHYRLHPLAMEDVLNTGQSPKAEDYPECLFLVLKSLRPGDGEEDLVEEQFSMVLGSHFVLSFQEGEEDIFAPVRRRIENRMGRIRRMGADYLAYALADTIVDHYFAVVDTLEEKIERVEAELMGQAELASLHAIHRLKREILLARKAIRPLREVVLRLERIDNPLLGDETRFFLRDLRDHVLQVAENVEIFREMAAGLLDLYHSTVSNRMNEVMKVLTIISTTFIPLSFLAGVYGMNFEHMPELRWRWSYPVFWAVIVAAAWTLLRFFKRKGWW
ncbi:MAG: magnesium/cobalt transporter CorA, partial [Desulfococcaceae bacterium]